MKPTMVINKCRDIITRMRNEFLYNIISRFEQEDIQYAILRGWEDVPNSMKGGDLDIWIEPSQYGYAKQIMREVLIQTHGQVVSFLDNITTPRCCCLSVNWGLQIDLHPMTPQHRCANIVPEGFIQKNTIVYNGCKVLSPDADVYLAFLKEILNNGYSQKDIYVSNLREKLKKNPLAQIKEDLSNYSDATITMLRNQVLDEKRQQYPELAKAMRKDILPIINIRYMRNQLMKWKRLFRHPGYVIAVLGTDGSGKSAIIDAITPWLNEAFHNGVTYKHLRPRLLNDIAVVLGKRKADAPKQVVVANPHSGKQSGFIGSMLRLMYYQMDYLFGYLKLIWPQIVMHTKVFIFDRYYYDYYIDQRRSLIKLPKWIIRWGELFVPKPDIILCLGGEPEKIYARKPETSLEEVTRQTEELQRFAVRRKNAVWIDTTQPIENSIRDAKTAILKMMSTRFKDVCSYNCTKMS